MIFRIEVAAGELIDKMTILEIKRARLRDASQLANVEREYAVLRESFDAVAADPALDGLSLELREVNRALWTIEDDIRDHERRRDFGDEFIGLARAVYKTNDKRSAIKRRINLLLNSRLIEEKAYTKY